MCGIAGIIGTGPVNRDAVAAMTELQAHRGPDDSGLWQSGDGRVVLGHRRLAVLDPLPRGHQPMVDETGTVALTFNGEIYNYLELAERLRADGVRFRTGTDTEVLLQGYLRWGDAVLAELNGMFAFALFDGRRRRLLCARDRFAEKPFLFAAGDGFFAFASEYKALLALAEVAPEIDHARVLGFLREPRLGLEDSHRTAFAGIGQLLGGERLVLDTETLDRDVSAYWRPLPDAALARLDEADAAARFRELLVDSVRLRLRSDVELGSCLSGGLDSSAIVCISRELLGDGRPYHVFCGRFPDSDADEWPFAREVVARTGAVAHEVFPDPARLVGELERFVWLNELPVGSTSQYAQWCVFEEAKRHGVTVLLDGQGGDELLAGYEQYFAPYLRALEGSLEGREIAAQRRRIEARYPGALPGRAERLKRALPEPVRRGLAHAFGAGSDFDFGLAAPPRRDEPGALPAPALNPLTAALAEDSFHAHLPTLLRYGDRNSMAHSREVRLPFCDHRIAELVLSVPPAMLMADAETKHLLRRGMAGVVPDAVRRRWNKQGFLPPQADWFRSDLLAALKEVLADPAFRQRGWWCAAWWQRAVRRFEAGEDHLAWVLWKVFIAEAWMTHFVARAAAMKKQPVFRA